MNLMLLANLIYPIILSLSILISLKFLKKFLLNLKLIDKPKKRSNHKNPTVKGAGLIIIPAIVFSILIYVKNDFVNYYPWVFFCLATLMLFIISFLDDIYSLPIFPRLLIQLFCVLIIMNLLNEDLIAFMQNVQNYFSINESFLRTIIIFLLILLWLWLINLFNFMDGMDGITASQCCTFSIGIVLISLYGKISSDYTYIGIILFACMISFLYWNSPPAKIFLGDVGSIPIGFLISSIIMINLIQGNDFVPLLILILFHFTDATLTLIIRILKRKKFFKAHSEHSYQKKIRNNFSHKDVLSKINFINFTLIIFSLFYYINPILSLFLSLLAVLIILIWLNSKNSKNDF